MVERKTRITLSMMPGRRHHFQIMALVLACVMPVSIAASVSPVSASDQTGNYRLYNPNSGEHFYTLDASEKNHLVFVGWRYEGVGWHSDASGSVPVYCQYNPNAKCGSHNYNHARLKASDFSHGDESQKYGLFPSYY